MMSAVVVELPHPKTRTATRVTALATPLTVPEMMRGHYLAIKRQFIYPVVALAILEALLVAFASSAKGESDLGMWAFMVQLSVAGSYAKVASEGAESGERSPPNT